MTRAAQAKTLARDPSAGLRLWLGAAALAMAGLTVAQAAHGQDTTQPDLIRTYGYSYYGDLSYPADFPHYTYVNPDAPQGGDISEYASGTFDSMNPYSRRGRSGRYSWAIYESLLETGAPFGDAAPADVYDEAYCLLCESLEYPPSKDWVIFHLRPEAHFSDGTPLTADDVVFTHNLFLEQGLPSYAEAVRQRVVNAEAIDEHTVRFDFAPGISRRSLIDQVGSTPVFSHRWFQEAGARLDEPRMETSPGSGPYVLDSFEVNRRITYRRDPNYWGRDLPINRGRHNFDVIRVEYFSDDAAAFEAFKTGEYTIRNESNSRQWATGYDFPAVTNGWITREEIPVGSPPTPTGFVFNLGHAMFQDRRVREALILAYNFEWTNQQLQYGLMAQRYSYSQGTRLEAAGLPEGDELALLQSLGDIVPPALLTEPAVGAHTSSADQLQDRRNLRRASRLLQEAGWTVGDDGVRRNADGQVMTIVFPYPSSGSATTEAVIESYLQNLRVLGIDAQGQKIDPAQYTERTRNRDYDMVFDSYVSFIDTGTGLLQRFGSEAADYSLFNPAGLADPVVDAVINASLMAETPEARDTALRALDRVLRWDMIMVPLWYSPNEWVAYWDVYRHPDQLPRFSSGALDWWWYDAGRADELRAAGAPLH
ncbi:MAG: ABC transporter substrate-binding protein [Rhodobacter sp.]|uniref:extracellular solute-binding protein n=1 Tax=Pararhodobacter sp. TaxID=2127056 RepID=UPI001DC11577|nr:extracellular solute-binding protein [Pararhodobacter sp.]MCB1344852.1 ABC transporter substrate-binding protein [Paracoccaceae bacterium]MCC0072210.1 ABC transporter substrate-binding protein [Rhodobacter sp.]HPD93868.1 extracellular solute-binding protein [Pararhodobacter sp.]